MGRSRSKEKPPGAKPAPVAPYLLKTWGPSKKVLWKTPVEALGAVLVLAISIFLASGLRRKLTHSDARPLPTKTASLGFRGGPVGLAKENGPCTVEEKAAWSKLARPGKFGDANG